MEDSKTIETQMKEAYARLPKTIQQAITSADVQKHLRALADTHKLHLDQWTALENEVMLALLGIEPIGALPKNIQTEVGVDTATSTALSKDISEIVFAPIRGELERLMGHPQAKAAPTTPVEQVRSQILGLGYDGKPLAAMTVMPATPPPAPPTQKVERAPIPPSYATASASHERKTVEGDPYREQIV